MIEINKNDRLSEQKREMKTQKGSVERTQTVSFSEFQDDVKRWTNADDKIGVPLSAGGLGSICGSSNKHMITFIFFM